MTPQKKLTTTGGAPVPDNQNVITAGPRGPMFLKDGIPLSDVER